MIDAISRLQEFTCTHSRVRSSELHDKIQCKVTISRETFSFIDYFGAFDERIRHTSPPFVLIILESRILIVPIIDFFSAEEPVSSVVIATSTRYERIIG